MLDVAVDHGPPQGPYPELLELYLPLFPRHLPGFHFGKELELQTVEVLRSLVRDGAHRDGGKSRVELRSWHGVPGMGTDEGFLEPDVRNNFV